MLPVLSNVYDFTSNTLYLVNKYFRLLVGFRCTDHKTAIPQKDSYFFNDIQGYSRLVDITAGDDFLGLFDQKS